MARQVYTPHFGGREWPLRFTGPDAVEIKRALGKNAKRVIDEDLLPPENGMVYHHNVDVRSLATLLSIGIGHDPLDRSGRKRLVVDGQEITYDVVLDWLTEYMETSKLLPLAQAVEDALYLCGAMGHPIDMVEARRLAAEEAATKSAGKVPEPSEEGKAPKTVETHSTVTQ